MVQGCFLCLLKTDTEDRFVFLVVFIRDLDGFALHQLSKCHIGHQLLVGIHARFEFFELSLFVLEVGFNGGFDLHFFCFRIRQRLDRILVRLGVREQVFIRICEFFTLFLLIVDPFENVVEFLHREREYNIRFESVLVDG
jgi:hypothetical protein